MAAAAITPPAVSVNAPPAAPPLAGSEAVWSAALALICDVRIEVKVSKFTVRDLLNLERKSLVVSDTKYGSNVPVHVNDLVLARSEFEVLGDKLAVRIMEFV